MELVVTRPGLLDTVSMSKIKILCLSLWYPLSMSRYFEKALRHREDVELLTAGVYTGDWIPWLGGMNVPAKYAKAPDIAVPFRNDIGEINYDIVKAQLPVGWVPDIVLCIDAGLSWKYKPTDGMVVHIATDPHALNYDRQRTISDKFFNMQLCYSKGKDIYLPYAYSQYDHYPVKARDEDGVDAALIGMPYEQRVDWVGRLRSKGVSVIFENGPIYDEARVLYNRAKIGLNWSSLNDLNARCFELPAMRLAPVMNLVPDIGKFFEQGKHYQGFSNINEAVDVVLWLKGHPHQREEIAKAAYENVQGQTYDKRIHDLLVECGFLA